MSTPSHHISGKRSAAGSKYVELAEEIESKFTKMADGILDRCTAATPADIDALDTMVDTADKNFLMIDAFSNTRKGVIDEVAIIVRYSTIKKYFPTV